MSYKVLEDIPLDLIKEAYLDHLEILKVQLGLIIHLQEIHPHQVKLICSLKDFHKEEDQKLLREALIEVSHKVFSIFKPQIKTPIVLHWELI